MWQDTGAMTRKRRLPNWSMWTFSIPTAIVFVGAGLAMEPSRTSIFLYVASVLCAGASVVRFIVKEIAPPDEYAQDRLAPDEQPIIETTRPIKL
jgi:hypothetical protein